MLNYAETASSSTTVSLSPVPSVKNEQDPPEYVPLRIAGKTISMVSSPLMDGYLAARKAYAKMEEEDDGPYFLLSGYEYAHLARQYRPAGLSPVDKREWQCRFIAGWNASTFRL